MFKLHRPLLLEYRVYKIFEKHISNEYEIKIVKFYRIKAETIWIIDQIVFFLY